MLEHAVLLAAEGNALPVSSVVFPVTALGFFALLGAITWSYRDVAHRHSLKTTGSAASQRPGQH